MYSRVIVQPSECSVCHANYDTQTPQRCVNECGCSMCHTCFMSGMMRTLFSCPNCKGNFPMKGNKNDCFSAQVEADHVEAQRKRCADMRRLLRDVEVQIDEIHDHRVVDSDGDYPSKYMYAALSDSSLEITSGASDIFDEYADTEYCVLTKRLTKLMHKHEDLVSSLSQKKDDAIKRSIQILKDKPLFDSNNDNNNDKLRTRVLLHLQQQCTSERMKQREQRRMRMLAHHGATVNGQKVKRKIKKKVDSDEEDDDDEIKESKRTTPDDISEILLALNNTSHYKKMTYLQRWKLKIHHWDMIIKQNDNYIELLDSRIDKATKQLSIYKEEILSNPQSDVDLFMARLKKKLEVLKYRKQSRNELVSYIWNKINLRLNKLQERLNVVPGKTRITQKLMITDTLRICLLTAFYPEQLPKVEEKTATDDDEDY